jgi:hypothetical protein
MDEILNSKHTGRAAVRLAVALEGLKEQLKRQDIKSIKLRWSVETDDQETFPNIDIQF